VRVTPSAPMKSNTTLPVDSMRYFTFDDLPATS
jgi:hypothetical protein